MRRAFSLILAAALIICVPAMAAPPRSKQSAQQPQRAEQVLAWINTYRSKPAPERMPEAIRALSAMGAFREIDTAGIYIGFAAGVLAHNPAKAESFVTAMFPMPPEDQVVIVRAIAYSGLLEWKALLTKFVERMPARRVLIERHLYGKAPGLMDLPLEQNPAALDTLWGFYFATGREEPIRRIISALPWSKDVNDVDKLTTGSMVKLTLAVNATRDHDLLVILHRQAERADKTTGPILREVIEASETYEMSKIRREALASIDEIKRKGPGDRRNMMWWGQVGQTALALGCVAASLTGHVEAGIPCVVGGALSSAALKFLAPQ
jgi:hypothetical protein